MLNLILKGQPDVDVLVSDFNYNCSVGIEDLMTMVNAWLTQDGDVDYNPDCDISPAIDEKIDLADYAVLASEWLDEIK